MKRVVAITGVAGGIGRGTARVFYEAGWVVVGIDRKNADDMHDVHRFIHADISDADAPHQIFETIGSKEGRLDALVNNAACQVCKPILETSPEEWDQVFGCNARSVFLSVKQAYPLLKMENVLLSAHNTNSSPAAWERVHQNTLKNLFEGLRQERRLKEVA